MATARAATLLAGFILSALLLMPVQWLGLKFGFSYARLLPNRYQRFLCWLIGIKVAEIGPALAEIKANGLELEHIYDY